jgi:transcription antitermination factor NusG
MVRSTYLLERVTPIVPENPLANNESAWFALTVEPNHERTVAARLRKKGFEVFLPVRRQKRRWSDRIKETESVLFPGYVFGRFKYSDRMRVLNLPGVRSIVCRGRDPIPIDESEIAGVRTLTEAGRPILSVPFVYRGQRVLISRGPLASLRGVIVRARDAWRVVVNIKAFDCAVAVELDLHDMDQEVAKEPALKEVKTDAKK